MITLDPAQLKPSEFHGWFLGAVIPRPIALVSSQDEDGNVNLSPFSFFNCFGVNPPILVFSPSRRGRDNTTKHTYENLREVPEAVVHIVNYSIVQQASLASTDYPRDTDEFLKAGFTPVASHRVKPPRVQEAPVAMECEVVDIIPTGEGGGAGNLVICKVVLMHVSEHVVGQNGRIDPFKLDAVARLGQDWYCRVTGETIFAVPRPNVVMGMGIDQLPVDVRTSAVLTGNELAQLALVEEIPAVDPMFDEPRLSGASAAGKQALHILARDLVREGNIEAAWQVLLRSE
jgi:flavin reductase (DIM6/NTAB) family NADH-FMN oxidoreductase RutF